MTQGYGQNDTLSLGQNDPTNTNVYNDNYNELLGDNEKDIEIELLNKKIEELKKQLKSSNKEYDLELFQKFYSAYPKKKNKGTAEKWFIKHKPDEETVNKMIESINKQKETEQWKKDNGQFIPYPSSWLNAKGWEDEVENNNQTKEEYIYNGDDYEIIDGKLVFK